MAEATCAFPKIDVSMCTEPDVPVIERLTTSLDPESEEWIRSLGASGNERDEAVDRLHELLLRVARFEARRRGDRLGINGAEVDDLSHQAASDALIAIVAKLEQFRGESRFTTWAYKFVVFEVSTKFRRHFWIAPTVPMGTEEWERLPDRFGVDPERTSERRELIDAMREAVTSSLTAHQREIFVAIVLNGTPLDVLVEQLGSSRNAIYKTLFDARRKLRIVLAANGYLDNERMKHQ
jgi:RNA polymerase sigma-70 factor (ECF subfamily)